LLPSDRVIEPRSVDTAAPDAVAVPLAGTGGHADAHAPEHSDLFMPSFVHMYTARPDPSVRYVPADPDLVVITSAAADPVAVLPAAGVLLPPLVPLLPQAAASSAVASSAPSLAGAGTRASSELLMLIVSDLGPSEQLPIDVTTAAAPGRLDHWAMT
jgi:hypothetical protein